VENQGEVLPQASTPLFFQERSMDGSAVCAPHVFLIGEDDDLIRELSRRLLPDRPTTLISNAAGIPRIWDHPGGVILMIDTHDDSLSPHMPLIAREALDRGFRVIRLARDTGEYSGIWDSRVLHLPQGVRRRVLVAALVGLSADEGQA